MSAEFFTKADWRPSKKRKHQKRINHYSGRKTAPAAFLEAAKRVAFNKGRTNRRICTAEKRAGGRCGNLALTGLTVCGCHGGYRIWAQQGKLQPTGKKAAIQAARAASPEDRTSAAPPDLIALQAYKQANQWTRMRMIRAFQTPAWPEIMRQIKSHQEGIKLYG